MPRFRQPSVDLEPLASVVQRLGVLLAAGVAPGAGWAYVAETARGAAVSGVRDVADAASRGESIAEAIVTAAESERAEASAWRGFAAAWLVASEAGAPLASTLAELAATLRSLAQNQRDIQTALAGPSATARMVLVLPVVAILFGMALGFDSIATLFTTTPGLVCLALGAGLMLLAHTWNRRLVRRARPTNLTPGLSLDLMAIAVSGGAAIPRARQAVAAARERCGMEGDDDGDSTIDEVLQLSRRAGIPAAALLRSEATEARRAARSAGERRAATLGVTLMLPLGLCILPAFMLLGVAPLLIAVVSSTVAGF